MASNLFVVLVAPVVLASSPARFLGQHENTACPHVGKVMSEVLSYSTQTLGGTLTGNLPNVLKIPEIDQIYGNNQKSIHAPAQHCKDQSNNYTKADFDEAWAFLECRLRRFLNNPLVASAFQTAVQGLELLVENAGNPPVSYPNPWIGATPEDFITFFREYFFFLPEPNGNNTGLVYILKENYFERNNPAAIHFLNTFKSMTSPAENYTTEIFDWTYQWVTGRGMLMDSAHSKNVIRSWVVFNNEDAQTKNTAVNMSAYKYFNESDNVGDSAGYGYKSFNQFFSRQFKNQNASRPISQSNADMVVTAPGDVEINFIYSKLRADTQIPIKGIHTMNVDEMLASSSYASKFVGGTAVSCVLMPYAYHNFHAPVDGALIEAVDVPGTLFGIPDGTAWFGGGNTGSPTTNFNIFGGFHRAYFLYNTTKYGLVAQIAVGLADVSTICGSVGSHVGWVDPGTCCCEGVCDDKPPCEKIPKGEHVGYFAYGGSLNILLFQAGAFTSMNVLMGNRIGSLSEPQILH